MMHGLKSRVLNWLGIGILWPTIVYGVEPTAIRLATGESFKPAIDFQKPGGGSLVENVRTIFQDMGYEVKIEPMPWKRAYLETQKATYLATFPWYKDGAREKDFYFSDPLFIQSTVAVVRKNSLEQRLTPHNIANKVTCDILGSTSWNRMQEMVQVRLVSVNDPEQCYQMLITGRIDFMFMHPDTAAAYLHQGLKVIDDDLHMNLSGHLIISRQVPHG